VLTSEYTGIIAYSDCLDQFLTERFQRLDVILHIEGPSDWADFAKTRSNGSTAPKAIASADEGVLQLARSAGLPTCLRATICGSPDLDWAIATGRHCDYIVLRFLDPTNIPLELVLAEYQSSRTAVLKEVRDPEALEDILASLGTMEVGADGLVLTPSTIDGMARVLPIIRRASSPSVNLEPARITASRAVGMGHRACVDLVTLFSPTEGLLVGSTSQGGVLCCAEVFHLPYMERRPFRINAGGVHSYVFGPNGRTQYLSELRAGLQCLVVDMGGETRTAPLGRVKIEIRPLRQLSCVFEGGEQLGLILQDDWHVRVFGSDGSPRNITELRPGDEVMAHRAPMGRHVGIHVSEFIQEH
jgi:3-dehydroquinate synthase II/3-amino-4-hydroxybenzoic acid synthase